MVSIGEIWPSLRALGRGVGVVEEQTEGGAHTICITDLASFWGIRFWNGMWLSWESRSIESVDSNMVLFFFSLALNLLTWW